MVEIERVMDAIADRPLTAEEIAIRLGCSKEAVQNVILLVIRRKEPWLYIKVANGGKTYAYTTRRPIACEEGESSG